MMVVGLLSPCSFLSFLFFFFVLVLIWFDEWWKFGLQVEGFDGGREMEVNGKFVGLVMEGKGVFFSVKNMEEEDDISLCSVPPPFSV